MKKKIRKGDGSVGYKPIHPSMSLYQVLDEVSLGGKIQLLVQGWDRATEIVDTAHCVGDVTWYEIEGKGEDVEDGMDDMPYLVTVEFGI